MTDDRETNDGGPADDGTTGDGTGDEQRSRGGERACYLRICPECDATCSIADERCPDCGTALESEPTNG